MSIEDNLLYAQGALSGRDYLRRTQMNMKMQRQFIPETLRFHADVAGWCDSRLVPVGSSERASAREQAEIIKTAVKANPRRAGTLAETLSRYVLN
jgi:hypothetical protein